MHLDTRGGIPDALLVCQYEVGTSSSFDLPNPISAIERVCDMRGSRILTIRGHPRGTANLSAVKGRTEAVDGMEESISDSVGRRTEGLDAVSNRPVIRSH